MKDGRTGRGNVRVKRYREGAAGLALHEKQGVWYLAWRELEEMGIAVHGISTRLGGVSEGELASMNLSFSRGDDPGRVRENFRRIAGAIGFAPESVVMSDQIHSTQVRRVTKEDRGSGLTKPRPWSGVDGLITDEPGVTLATFYADCVPLFFVDPARRAIGLSHSGWRGTANRMAEATVRAMEEAFGTRAEDLVCGIGPSICRDCYEVSGDVIDAIREHFPRETWERLYEERADGKFQLDLWESNRQVLLEAGVREERIHLPNLCTCCNPELLFSHRASKGRRGNLGAFLALKPVGA